MHVLTTYVLLGIHLPNNIRDVQATYLPDTSLEALQDVLDDPQLPPNRWMVATERYVSNPDLFYQDQQDGVLPWED